MLTALPLFRPLTDDQLHEMMTEAIDQTYSPGQALVDTARRAALLLKIGEARLGRGDREGARQGFFQAAALARDAGLAEVLARAALGLGSGPAGFEVGLLDQEQLDLLEEARQRLPEQQQVLRALVMARLSVAATMIDSDERRLALAHEALLKQYADRTLTAVLSEREKLVLQMRFGLDDGRIYPLERIGQRLSLTRERVRQIEAVALRKLRDPSVSNRLRDYLSA